LGIEKIRKLQNESKWINMNQNESKCNFLPSLKGAQRSPGQHQLCLQRCQELGMSKCAGNFDSCGIKRG
jgi:hypothetical protein